jgi:ubiquinone/menaquinone biosynthesis C-methylase UbiE
MEVVGIDLNDGLGLSNLNKGRYVGKRADNINYVQGNLFNSPFRHCQFDLLYCSGVIHHTPSSKETFGRLVPLVKRGGRMYVWVYGKRSIPVRAFFAAGRQLKRFMSLESLLTTCRVIAPFYKLGTTIVNELRISKFRRRNCREITLDLFDAFAPQYNHWHTEEEVQGWFSEEGFANIAVSGRQKHGFGVHGDRL